MTRTEKLIYMAGFFDGEGCVHLSRGRQGKGGGNLSVIIVQKQMLPLDLAMELWPQGRARITHRQGKDRGYYQFQLNGKAAADALVEMFPYLRGKRDQAKLAIDYQDALHAFRAGKQWKFLDDQMLTYRNDTAAKLSEMKRCAGATTESLDSWLSEQDAPD